MGALLEGGRRMTLQELYELQGFIVLAHPVPERYKVGEVIHFSEGSQGYPDIDGPMVVIGPATSEDWHRQHATLGIRVYEEDPAREFWKVAAE
jgi:hypothetical protein